jgi:hypothetical protein
MKGKGGFFFPSTVILFSISYEEKAAQGTKIEGSARG